MPKTNNEAIQFRELCNRHDSLATKRIQVEERLRTKQDELERLKEQARQNFGTDEVASLQRRLDEERQQNQEALQNYRNHLDSIEANLARTEQGGQS